MKKGILVFAFTLFSLFFLIQAKNSDAACRPKNDWTGLCDVGTECLSGICCDSPVECSTANPADYNYPTHDTTGTEVTLPSAPPKKNSDPTCEGGKGIDTAIGCINVLDSPEAFLGDILKWAVGVGGGIAFLLIIYASFMIMTSAGNPERLKAGQELLTSAISGLILLIFSIFILKFIGVDILKIPGFGQSR